MVGKRISSSREGIIFYLRVISNHSKGKLFLIVTDFQNEGENVEKRVVRVNTFYKRKSSPCTEKISLS
jgi:hypothetical protein